VAHLSYLGVYLEAVVDSTVGVPHLRHASAESFGVSHRNPFSNLAILQRFSHLAAIYHPVHYFLASRPLRSILGSDLDTYPSALHEL